MSTLVSDINKRLYEKMPLKKVRKRKAELQALLEDETQKLSDRMEIHARSELKIIEIVLDKRNESKKKRIRRKKDLR